MLVLPALTASAKGLKVSGFDAIDHSPEVQLVHGLVVNVAGHSRDVALWIPVVLLLVCNEVLPPSTE